MGFHESDELTARDLVRQLSMQSYSGGMRVLLLGDIDFANPAAANALLKFLEEPPEGVVMILTTSVPGRLLPTIRSRLVEVRFPLLSKTRESQRSSTAAVTAREMRREPLRSAAGASRKRGRDLESEEESLRAHVERWFFESVGGKTPRAFVGDSRDLDEGLETIKTLVRDWIVAGGAGRKACRSLQSITPLACERLPPPVRKRRSTLLAKLDDAATARRGPTCRGDGRRVRPNGALDGARGNCVPEAGERDVVVLFGKRKGEIGEHEGSHRRP